MTVGERIKLIRKEKGMTQKQVADRCGMADSAIRKYESGQVTPKQDTLQRIAGALGVHLLDLIGIGEELDKDVKLFARVDTSEVDDLIGKAEHLSALLKEANSLARELASLEIGLKLNIEF